MTYQVRKPLQVIREGTTAPLSFVEIEPGSIITVKNSGIESGRVDVLYDDQIFGAIMSDIEERADMMG